jgi:predicted metal-binding membrane protein
MNARAWLDLAGVPVLAVAVAWSLMTVGEMLREAACLSGIFVLAAGLRVTEACLLFAGGGLKSLFGQRTFTRLGR